MSTATRNPMVLLLCNILNQPVGWIVEFIVTMSQDDVQQTPALKAQLDRRQQQAVSRAVVIITVDNHRQHADRQAYQALWPMRDLAAERQRISGSHHVLVLAMPIFDPAFEKVRRYVAFAVEGTNASLLLAAGCPLDLHPDFFTPGSATRTLLGKAEIVLWRLSEASSYRVECARSFGRYVERFLDEAAREWRS